MIRVDAKRNAGDELVIVTAECLVSTVAPVGDKYLPEIGRIQHALRFALTADAENALANLIIDDFNSVLSVAKGGRKKPMAVEIDTKVVHPASHAGHRDTLHQSQLRPGNARLR